ncbi:MAG: GMC family oxidoreductase [Flavobacteriaceae bacterium]
MTGKEIESETFDFIVIGGGTAGCVVASRLSEDPGTSVCLIEAGPRDTNPFIRMPAGFFKTLFNPRITWQFAAEPSPRSGRRVEVTQGRTLGGSSAINGMIINRGQAQDFDDWADMGNAGWNYESILPYFKKFEHFAGEAGNYRGHGGPLPVGETPFPLPAADAFTRAAMAMGVPYNADSNGREHHGVGPNQFAIHSGRRVSTAHAYLQPARSRRNLEIRTGALVCGIVFAGARATGVDYLREGSPDRRRLLARRGVIVSAGTIGTPRLLQLSGLGAPATLASAGVETVRALPGIGRNLHDHYNARLVARGRSDDTSINRRVKGWRLLVETMRWTAHQPSVLGIGPGVAHLNGYSKYANGRADYSLLFMPGSMKKGFAGRLDDFPGFTCGGWTMRPRSAGFVEIASSDPREAPKIQLNHLADEHDRAIAVESLKMARSLLMAKEMEPFIAEEIFPGPDVHSDDDWLAFAMENGGTSYHYSGTARMGAADDPEAVVDNRLQVHGFEGLHVVDASIMPSSVSANTQAATMMIAEKGADLIRQR